MQDIDKFGFNLMALAEKENYPWASPEAAIESELQMSPEEFIQNSFELFSEFEAGTEGVIGDAWTWFTNLIRRFWNWITGNNKKEKAKIEKVEEKIKTLNKEYKNPPVSKTEENPIKEDMLRNKEEFNKAMTDQSTRLEIGADGVKAKHVYWAPVGEDDLGVIDSLVNMSFSVTLLHKKINNLLYALDRSKSWDDFLQLSNNEAVKQFVLILNESTKDIDNVYSNLKIKSYDNIKDAAAVNNIYYSKLKYIKKASLDLESIIGRLNNSIKNIKLDPNSNNSMAKPTSTVFTKFITKDYPNYKKSIDNFVTKLDNLYSDAIKRNRISAKANGLGNESEELDQSLYGFATTSPSIASEYAYEGLEEEYHSIKKLLSECDAEANEYFDDYVFFGGTEGFVDTVKLYGHKIWDAIRRFFYWIASKFSDKYKEKYAIEKVRAGFNSLVSEYSDYMSYNEFHEGYNIGKSAMDSLMKELAASGESQHINLFGITSGLESSEEGKSITVTDYAAMNKAMDQIGEDAKDLAKFTKFLVDMMKNYQASETDFKSCLTPGLKEFPNKLSRIKFPGTKTITPKEAGQFKKEVNEALDNCKQFKAVIDFLNKNKTSVDKYLAHPAIKDHEMTKAIIEAMNRYYIPAVKQITNIIDWYLRCINTDMRKMKDAINSK